MVRFEQRDSSGWPRNMFALPLPDGRTLVHSPTWIGDETFQRIEAVGRPGILFAPNHFHHRWLTPFRERYPDALAVASEAALPRLRTKGHRGLRELADAEPLLAEGMRFLRCQGLRSGEAWLSFLDGGTRTLIVSDAFFHVRQPVTGFAGFMLRRLATLPGLRIGNTFRWLAVGDRMSYRAWATETLAREAPARLAFSHGDVLDAGNLGARLATLIDERIA